MRKRVMLILLLATATIGPASAQQVQRGGIRTETESRLAEQGADDDMEWDLVGLLGLLGLLGLGSRHPEDGYHPSTID